MSKDILRRCIFRPYRKGQGPVFSLTMWWLGERIGYCLRIDGKPLFEGEDFGPSPLHAIDSDDTVNALMGFLTALPGNMDDEYFKEYTQEQLDYCATHAEALSYTVDNRYGENSWPL